MVHDRVEGLAGEVGRLRAERRLALLSERTRRLAQRAALTTAEPAPAEQALICTVGDNLFAIPLREVSRVRRLERYATAPSPEPALVGLVAEAGRARQVLDLVALLGGAPSAERGGWILVLAPPLDAALRVEHLPQTAALEPLPDRRGRIATGAAAGRIATLLSPRTLLAGAADTTSGADPS
jgi:hypothetical protein